MAANGAAANGSSPDDRTKVAVLGGGAGGITAAFELTATAELRQRYQVTVYELGWRLGGKGASGRNAARGQRIEEHGLHLWFGFYDNAFRLMRDAYEELGRPAGQPLASFEEAFSECDQLILYDRQGEGWHAHAFEMPRNFMRPGDPGELPTLWEIAATACGWALGRWGELRDDRDGLGEGPGAQEVTPVWFADLAREVASDLLEAELAGAEHLLHLASRLAGRRARRTDLADSAQGGHPWFLARLLSGFRDWLWVALGAQRLKDDPDLRLFFTVIDTMAATLSGVVADGVLQHGWDVINDEEWTAWLRRHGAHEITVGSTPAERSPVLRSVYDVAFGYPGGDIGQANVAAGTATNDLLRLLFSYRGSLIYKMQAGMGDVVFGPLYEVLRRRGVRFEFFHAVTGLGLAAEEPIVDTVDLLVGAEAEADEYEPLIDVGGLPCWPNQPLWEQLQGGEKMRQAGVDFEGVPHPGGRELLLRRGDDFDQVVLAIPIGALGAISGELIERDERFRRAVETAVTVPTQAFQLWMDRTSSEIGWAHEANSVAGCYVEPLDTYCEMSHLIPREGWSGEDGVGTIAYFCGVLDERSGEAAAGAAERVRANAAEFLESDAPGLWPAARSGSAGFDWSLLVDRSGASGTERLASQYWRANVSPSQRYVLTPAGTVGDRLRSDQSGFANLVLAGDWTRNGIDGGCVEAAVISGMQAARQLTGERRPVTGETKTWLAPRPTQLPPYVEYGGRATAPGPFLSLRGRLRGYLLEGDRERISALVERMLNEPAGPGVDYRALGSKVLLQMGGFEHVSSMVPPFDRWGDVREIVAAFWVPVLAGHDLGEVFVGERFGLALPYIFVDNPMSYLGGRETYGYAKTMGRFDPADGVGDSQRMETFGGNFGRNEGAEWHTILEIEGRPGRGADAEGPLLEGPEAVANLLAGDPLARNDQGEIVLPGVKLASGLVEELLEGRMRQVFLKQFRDAAEGTRACYQSVVEAPIVVKRVSLRPSERVWDLTIHHLDSHPIEQEIGIASQRALMAFDGELDMVVETGVEIGRVAAPSGEATRAGDAASGFELSGGAVAGLLVDTAKALVSELPGLGRLKWW